MTIQELFIASNQALAAVIAQITEDQWTVSMPAGTTSKASTLIEAVRYHTYDDAWVPDVLAGKTKDEVGNVYEYLLSSSDNAKTAYAEHNQRATDAVSLFNDLDMLTHLSYGDYPAPDYLQHIISFRAFRAYDIAKLINVDTALDDEFVKALIAEFSPVIELYRQMGVFPAAVAVGNDASAQTKLLAMVGRN